MKKPLLTIAIFWAAVSFAQDYSRQELKQLEDADIDYEIGDFMSALNVYEELIKGHVEDAELQLKTGVSYFYLRQYEKADAHLLRAREMGLYEANYYPGANISPGREIRGRD